MVNKTNNGIGFQRSQSHGGSTPPFKLVQVLICLGVLGLTSSGLAIAETTGTVSSASLDNGKEDFKTSADYLAPAVDSSHRPTPSAVPSLDPASATQARPEFSPLRPSPSVVLPSQPSATNPMQPAVPPSAPAAIVIPAPAAGSTMAESLLKPATTVANGPTNSTDLVIPDGAATTPGDAEAIGPERAVPAEILADESVPTGYNSVFIDPTNYNLGATQAPAVAPDVVFAERSTGCQITVAEGGSPNSTCETTAARPVEGAAGSEVKIGPVSIGSRGVSLGNTTIISREFLNERVRPLNVLRRGNEEYVFPLSVPSSISSLFGWRMHPIHQSWRFHSGTDLAAPMGTPVLATRAGRVTVSDFLGGYGLTVILRHGEDNLESRYAHLSQVAVKSGEWVEQGEVIGLVGSTGTSTGPHLHFEVRQLTEQGWVAVDPAEILEYGVANLLEIIDNPMLALGRSGATADDGAAGSALPTDYPYRPAQPNAS